MRRHPVSVTIAVALVAFLVLTLVLFVFFGKAAVKAG